MSRQYLVFSSAVCEASSPRGSRDDNEDTTRSMMTRYCPHIWEGGAWRQVRLTAPCVVYVCEAFGDRYWACSVWMRVRESAMITCGSAYYVLCSPHLLHWGTPRGYIKHFIQHAYLNTLYFRQKNKKCRRPNIRGDRDDDVCRRIQTDTVSGANIFGKKSLQA